MSSAPESFGLGTTRLRRPTVAAARAATGREPALRFCVAAAADPFIAFPSPLAERRPTLH